MRVSVFLFIAMLVLCGCGAKQAAEPEPPVPDYAKADYDAAMKDFEAMLAETPAPAKPGFKISPTNATGMWANEIPGLLRQVRTRTRG